MRWGERTVYSQTICWRPDERYSSPGSSTKEASAWVLNPWRARRKKFGRRRSDGGKALFWVNSSCSTLLSGVVEHFAGANGLFHHLFHSPDISYSLQTGILTWKRMVACKVPEWVITPPTERSWSGQGWSTAEHSCASQIWHCSPLPSTIRLQPWCCCRGVSGWRGLYSTFRNWSFLFWVARHVLGVGEPFYSRDLSFISIP